MVDLFEDHEFVGKEPEGPLRVPFGWIATGEFDEAGLLVTVEFAFIVPVGIAAVNRRDPSFGVAFPSTIGRRHTAVEGATDAEISRAVISLQQNAGSGDVFGLVNAAGDERFEFSSLVFGKIDGILFVWHRWYSLLPCQLAPRK